MTRHARHLAVLCLAGLVASKVTVAAFAARIPGQPFHGFEFRDWVLWIVRPSEVGFVLAILLVEYGLLYFVTSRLSIGRLIGWGAVMGSYVAITLFPFDLLARVDDLPVQYWPRGLVGAALELMVFFFIVPLVFALLLSWRPRVRGGRTLQSPDGP